MWRQINNSRGSSRNIADGGGAKGVGTVWRGGYITDGYDGRDDAG